MKKTAKDYCKKWKENNREKVNAIARAYYRKNKGKVAAQVWATQLKYKFDISKNDYDEMFSRQGGLCAICREPETRKMPNSPSGVARMAVDHCHSSGKVRGLLCHRCNIMIGYSKDRPNVLYSAFEYLKGNEHA